MTCVSSQDLHTKPRGDPVVVFTSDVTLQIQDIIWVNVKGFGSDKKRVPIKPEVSTEFQHR